MSIYNFSIQNDFLNHVVAPGRLSVEIQSSPIVTALDCITTAGDICGVAFKAALSVGDVDVLGSLVAAHAGEPLPDPTTADGVPIVTLQSRQADGVALQAKAPRVGSEIVIGSHNFADPTTWFGDALRAEDEALVDSGDGLKWGAVNHDWIDMRSGRMHNQEHWAALVDHGYAVEVKVDGAVKVHCEPFDFTSDTGDYWVDYDRGEVHFFTSQAGKVVTATYSYADGSVFYVTPLAGKVLRIEDAEADFSSDMVMLTSFAYIVEGFVEVFAPHLCPVPFPPGTRIPLQTDSYRRTLQIVTEARGSLPPIHPVGATAEHLLISDLKEFRRKSRGMKHAVQAVPFNYSTARDLHSSYGMRLKIALTNGVPIGGEHMTMTLYCTSKDEG